MPSVPTAIGPFHIERELGRGGMGVVYLARDTRLDRLVAIKALPDHLVDDPDRLARFQREAKTLASLNHPNIASIYGLESHERHQYLVLEYVEGETLADILKRGPVPMDEALGIARHIGEALEAAHEKGVVHRDIKPGNVIITPDGIAKVLDFGLARTAEGTPSTSSFGVNTDSPTLTTPHHPVHSPTIPGAIMGTAGYMSPEQARGKLVDKRSDIFSFGCVLFEILTGARPFTGETVADALGATLHKELNLGLLPPNTPVRIREVLTNCLAKDRRNRLHDIGDARIEIERAIAGREWASSGAPSARVGARTWVPWLAAAVVCALVSVGALLKFGAPHPAPDQVIRSSIAITVGTLREVGDAPVALSPDGRTLAFVAAPPGEPARLWIRSLDSLSCQPLVGTEDAAYPFWSPDSKHIGFFSKGKLRRIPAVGGTVTALCDSEQGRGGTWNEEGTIVFAPEPYSPLMRIAAAGGTPTPITQIPDDKSTHRLPCFLPGGKRVLYTQGDDSLTRESTEIALLDLTTGSSTTLLKEQSRAFYSPPGYLVFIRGTSLMAQPFDAPTGRLSGEAVVLGEGVSVNTNRFTGAVSVAPNGTLVYLPGAALSRLEWFDKDGRSLGAFGEPADFTFIALSRAGDKAAATIRREDSTIDGWLCDTTRGSRTRFVENIANGNMLWSPDATRVTYGDLHRGCVIHELGATTKDTVVTQGWASAWSRDGTLLAIGRQESTTYLDIHLAKPDGTEVYPFRASADGEQFAAFSPDGAWIAYVSDATGKQSVVVAPVSGARAEIQIAATTPGNLDQPLSWLDDGTLIFPDSSGRKLVAVPATFKDGTVQFGAPIPAFGGLDIPSDVYAVTSDGTRMLAAIPVNKGSTESLILVQNWPSAIAPAR